MKIKVYQSVTDEYKDMEVIGKYKYIKEDYGISLTKGKIYYRVEPKEEFRIVDNTGEDYIFNENDFEEVK